MHQCCYAIVLADSLEHWMFGMITVFVSSYYCFKVIAVITQNEIQSFTCTGHCQISLLFNLSIFLKISSNCCFEGSCLSSLR